MDTNTKIHGELKAINSRKQFSISALQVLFVLIVSFVMLLIFSLSTSPFYKTFGNDGLEYKLAGAAILDGLVIFKDIFHQKGALFFFVQAIGEALCRLFNNEKMGTFLIQYVNLCAVMWVILKIEKNVFQL